MTSESRSAGEKLLSICTMGRDDDFAPDFRYRLTTTVNYLARNLFQLGRLDDVEIVVTDWGSEVPLAKSLALSPQAAEICRFVFVPPEVVRTLQGGRDDFHTSFAINSGIRRAQGEFILIGAGDTLIPQHSLDMILRVIENKLSLSVRADKTVFLCPRYHIPWQFVEHQPELEAWDRYLLLSASELNYTDESKLGIFSGVGGFLMHRDLWQEARGFDERFGGWGFQDIDLGLRISQTHPWIGLSSLGVNSYHMGHRPVGRRTATIANANPHNHNSKVQANSEGWGLRDWEFHEQRPGAECAHNAIAVEESDCTAIDCPKKRIDEIAKEMAAAPVLEHVRRCVRYFPRNPAPRDEIEALVFLAWHSLRCLPRCYLEFGVRRGYAAAVVAAANPAAEIYGFDEWEGVTSDDTDVTLVFNRLRFQIGHRAYVRFLNGPLHTGVVRLRESFVGPFRPDLVLVRGDRLGEHLARQIDDLLKCLAPGGAIVITRAQTGVLESLWTTWTKEHPQIVLFLGKSQRAGMILAEGMVVPAQTHFAPICCDFDIGPILWRTKIWSTLRVLSALSQPERYPEFAARFFRLLSRYVPRK